MRRTWWTRAAWVAGAIVLPVLLLGSLLGVVADADSATERIPVALVNSDELIRETDEAGDEQIIFASRPLVTELVGSEDLRFDWVITNQEQAAALLASGEVYAVIEIPENFSRSVQSLGGESPEQATFTIRTDPSRSYLAGLLADQIGETIAAGISRAFSREISQGLLDGLVALGDALTESADAAQALSEGTKELSSGTSQLREGVGDLNEGVQDLNTGYREFDEGLATFTSGVSDLAAGAATLERETRALPELASGIQSYTQGVAGVSTGLQALNDAGVFAGIAGGDATVQAQFQGLLSGLQTLSTQGSTLSTQSNAAISGVRQGITGIESGARALSTGGSELRSGSLEIRDGVGELADGVNELFDGVVELDEGVIELADGVEEFATGLQEGADEFADGGLQEQSDSAMDVLSQPVVFEGQDRSGEISALQTVSSVFIPVGLWFAALLFFLIRPPLSGVTLAGSAPLYRLYGHALVPVLGGIATHTVIGVLLLHTVGRVPWESLPATTLLLALGSTAYMLLHFAGWLWRPALLGAISIPLAIVQIVTLRSVIPAEILPGPYQLAIGLTPMTWFVEALQGYLASVEVSRLLTSASLLVAVGLAAALAGALALHRARLGAALERVGITRD